VLDEFNNQVLRITGNAGTDRVTIEPDPDDDDFFRVTSQQSRNPTPVVARFPSSRLGFLIVDLGSGDDVLEVVGARVLGEIPRVGARPVDIAPGPGDDYVRFDADANAVRFQGGGGNDTFDNNPERGGPKALHGGPGNDTLIGGRSNDFIDGGTGNDVIEGHARADNLIGGDGDDQIDGGRAAKSLDGVDTIQGGLGRDTVAGYAGVDRIFGFVSSPFGDADNPNVFDRAEALGLEVRDYREGIDVIV
jgi:Ca2+-binding RTX toxin-like protein